MEEKESVSNQEAVQPQEQDFIFPLQGQESVESDAKQQSLAENFDIETKYERVVLPKTEDIVVTGVTCTEQLRNSGQKLEKLIQVLKSRSNVRNKNSENGNDRFKIDQGIESGKPEEMPEMMDPIIELKPDCPEHTFEYLNDQRSGNVCDASIYTTPSETSVFEKHSFDVSSVFSPDTVEQLSVPGYSTPTMSMVKVSDRFNNPKSAKSCAKSKEQRPTRGSLRERSRAIGARKFSCNKPGCGKDYYYETGLKKHFFLCPSHREQDSFRPNLGGKRRHKSDREKSKDCAKKTKLHQKVENSGKIKSLEERLKCDRFKRRIFRDLTDNDLLVYALPRILTLLSAPEYFFKTCIRGIHVKRKALHPLVLCDQFEEFRVKVEEKLYWLSGDPERCYEEAKHAPPPPFVKIKDEHLEGQTLNEESVNYVSVNDQVLYPMILQGSSSHHTNQLNQAKVITPVFLPSVVSPQHVSPLKPLAWPTTPSSSKVTQPGADKSKAGKKTSKSGISYLVEKDGKVTMRVVGQGRVDPSDNVILDKDVLKFMQEQPTRSASIVLDAKDHFGKKVFQHYIMPAFFQAHVGAFEQLTFQMITELRLSTKQSTLMKDKMGKDLEQDLGINIFVSRNRIGHQLCQFTKVNGKIAMRAAKVKKESSEKPEKKVYKKRKKEKDRKENELTEKQEAKRSQKSRKTPVG